MPTPIEWPTVEAALDWLERQDVLSDRQVADLMGDIAGRIRVDVVAMRRAFDDQVVEQLQESLAAGEGRDAWRKRVSNFAPGLLSNAETIGRTFTHRAMFAGQKAAAESPIIAEEFPYLEYFCTADSRSRATHVAMDGKVAHRDSPLAKEMEELLASWNCRCSVAFIDRESAVSKGIDDDTGWREPERVLIPANDDVPVRPVVGQTTTATLPTGQQITYKPHDTAAGRRGFAFVEADPAVIDRLWQHDEGFYLPPDSGDAKPNIPGRKDRFREFMAKGEAVEASRVTVKDGKVYFDDGRHRFAVLRDAGIDKVGLSMTKEDAAKLQRLLVSDADTRPSFAKVVYPDAADRQRSRPTAGVNQQIKYMNSRANTNITPDRMASLVGATDDAVVKVGSPDYGLEVNVRIEHSDYTATRTVKNVEGFGLVIDNDFFEVGREARGKGLGTEVFSKQVRQAQLAGVKEIRTYAAKSEDLNGYYTWAKLGYDGPLPPSVMAKLPPELSSARTVQDLFSLPFGDEWWKANGEAMNMKFDLREDSVSTQALRLYTRIARAKKKGAERAG